ncbi:hypothetical protein EBH_0014500 [Eimeria brunetti]|uniref:Reverse transcriptase domain-containing protein n=1 Tax=Eimeria brunetti TaxID=51314 RepID=U6LET8_9EIME|nr:hypothetical protein EBH_0014500 [Eimeria brunetti]
MGQQDHRLGNPVGSRLTVAEEFYAADGKPAVKISHMEYADDLKTVGNSHEGINSLHQVVKAFLQWTGLEANPPKCATMGWKALLPLQAEDGLVRSYIRAVLKVTFKLSKSTASEVFHQPSSHGGLGCTSLQTIATATQIGHAVQILNSKDSMIQAVAEGQLLEVTKREFVYTPDSEDSDREATLAYLNDRDLGCLKKRGKKVDIRSL